MPLPSCRGLARVALGLAFAVVPATAQVRHVTPTDLAASVGDDLPWQRDLASALAAAQKLERPILWYLATVPGSPMDRKPVVDLYMRAGLFSDPDIRPLLARFVLLRTRASRAEAKKYDLRPFEFIEPGFLVLDAQGRQVDRAHALTTFSPTWLATRLSKTFGGVEAVFGASTNGREAEPANALRVARLTGRYAVMRALVSKLDPDRTLDAELGCQAALALLADAKVAEAIAVLDRSMTTDRVRFLAACCAARSGRQSKARELWRELSLSSQDALWSARAAAEAERFGPISRGFWSFRALPTGWRSDGAGTTNARSVTDLPMLRSRSLEFLLAMQAENGGFEDSNYDFGGLDSLPNVYVAVTALVCQAMLLHRTESPTVIDAALHKGVGYCMDPARRNDADEDEWIWARVYTLELLASLLDEHARSGFELEGYEKARLQRELALITREIFTRQDRDGSFRHEYTNPFVTATVLHALTRARKQGVPMPEPEIQRALASLERCRTKLGAYSYSQTRSRRSARGSVAGSAGRMPLCESALFVWHRSDRALLAKALEAAFEHHDQLERTRKYDDHAGRLGYGGFFFWYDMRARTRAMTVFGESGATVETWRKKQLEILLGIPEIDGVFVDSHELGRCYGAAMALLSLTML